MHEQAYIDAILKNIDDVNGIKELVIEVGELAGIEGGHLREHIVDRFGWDVEIIKKNAVVKCECGFEGRPKIVQRLHDFVVFECSSCGDVPSVVEGEDIKIIKVIYF